MTAELVRLGRVLAAGVHPPDLPWAICLDDGDWLKDPALRAAEHTRVFHLEVFAWESVFTRGDGLRDDAQRVTATYAENHLQPPAEPDGLGNEILLYTAAGQPFLEAHLGRWAPAALLAVARTSNRLYREIALGLISLLAPELQSVLPPEESFERLEDLLTPARSGVYLSRPTIQRLSDEAGVPCGFGSRRRMLQTLVASAASHERTEALDQALAAELGWWRTRYASFGLTAWARRIPRIRCQEARSDDGPPLGR